MVSRLTDTDVIAGLTRDLAATREEAIRQIGDLRSALLDAARDRDEARAGLDRLRAEATRIADAMTAEAEGAQATLDRDPSEEHSDYPGWEERIAALKDYTGQLRALLDGPTPAPNTTQPTDVEQGDPSPEELRARPEGAVIRRRYADLCRAVALLAGEAMRAAQSWDEHGPHCDEPAENIHHDHADALAGIARRMLALVPDVPPDMPAGPTPSATADAPAPGQGQDTTDTQEAQEADHPPPARQIPPPPHVKPRTWSLPAEPGPEVTAVKCDCHARRWHRDGPLWQGSGWRGEVYRWPGLLAYHPHLTDATETGADQ